MHISELQKIEDEKNRILDITEKKITSIMVNKKKKYDQMMDPGSALSKRSKKTRKSKGSFSASFKRSVRDESS